MRVNVVGGGDEDNRDQTEVPVASTWRTQLRRMGPGAWMCQGPEFYPDQYAGVQGDIRGRLIAKRGCEKSRSRGRTCGKSRPFAAGRRLDRQSYHDFHCDSDDHLIRSLSH